MSARSRKRLEWSARADRDLFDAWAFIAAESVASADAVEARLVGSAERLIDYPMLGKIGRVPGTRELPVGHTSFTLIYRVRRAKVLIARILHQRRKYP